MNSSSAAASLRDAVVEDVDAISHLRVEFWADQVQKGLLDLRPFDMESLRTETRGFIGRQRSHLLVVEREGEILSYIYGQVKIVPGAAQARVAVIEELFVRRSKATVSSALILIRAMIERLIESGAERIQCRVLYANEDGKALQEACGFQPNLIVYEYPF